jgi:tRNA A-37 threonylcarbamoyl transferase component Bud32
LVILGGFLLIPSSRCMAGPAAPQQIAGAGVDTPGTNIWGVHQEQQAGQLGAKANQVITTSQQTLAQHPDDSSTAARLKQAQEQRAASDQQRNEVAAKFPDSQEVQNAAADASVQVGDWQGALNYGQRSVDLAGNDPSKLPGALKDLALAEIKTGDLPEAAANSKRALDMNPSDPQLAYDLKGIYHDATDAIAAQAASAKAGGVAKKMAQAMEEPALQPGGFHAASNHENPENLKATAQNLAAAGHMKDAKRMLDMGDAEGALAAAEAAENASPDFKADAAVMQAQAWSVLKDLTKALMQITEAIKLFAQQGRKGDLAAAYSQRAGFNNDLKKSADAAADANSALEADPKLASAYYERARADDAQGKTDQALADIDQAATLDAGFMADRDDFHKRHRAALPGDEGASSASAAAGKLKSVGLFNVGIAAAGLLLISLAGYIGWISRKSSPVHRITWPRISRAAQRDDDDPRDLNSQYKIVKKIGEGGMGTVYEGYDKNLKRPVAIKRLRPELQKNARERARFIKEAELVAALQHPHTVQIYTIIQNDEDTHIVFEYITGQTLHDVLNASAGRHLETGRALELLRQMAEAVDHAHDRHVIHRDLKPANVMIDDRGWAKVMDFGIARQVADSLVHTTTNTIVGTPTYMAPEQSMGEVKKESDVYALGITFYEMLTGGLPFKGSDNLNDKISGRFLAPSLLLPGLPPAIDAVIAKAIAPRAEDRYHCCMDLYRAAESALGSMTPT